MKILKIITIPIFIILVFFSCKKTDKVPNTAQLVSTILVKNNVVTFNSFTTYLTVAEN